MNTNSITIPITTTGIGARISASQKLPVNLKIDSPKNAPSMKNEPCARLTTFISPKISDSPAAMRNSSTPYTSPFRSWATSNSMQSSASGAFGRTLAEARTDQ